jgi:hypothetical protein
MVRPFHRCSINLAKDGIHEAGSGTPMPFGEFDSLVNSSVYRNAVEIPELKQAHAHHDSNFVFHIGRLAVGVIADQEIKLALVAQAAKYDLGRQAGISRVHPRREF